MSESFSLRHPYLPRLGWAVPGGNRERLHCHGASDGVEPSVVEFGKFGVELAALGFNGEGLAADGAEHGGWDAGLFGLAEGAIGIFGRNADDDAGLRFAEKEGIEAAAAKRG